MEKRGDRESARSGCEQRRVWKRKEENVCTLEIKKKYIRERVSSTCAVDNIKDNEILM